jgi:GNAT superfamily N-acetyltransferase
MVEIRRITELDDYAIAQFGTLQERAYSEPENLIPGKYLPWVLSHATREQRNFMLVAESEDRVVGGTVFHLFTEANAGFSSFLAVAPEMRGQGISRRLHEARFEVLDREAGKPVEGIFIDVLAPERLTKRQLARERKVGSDPRARMRIFGRLGFYRVGIRYEQPVGGPDGGPVTDMDLLYCPRAPADTVPTALVVATLYAYWSSWLGPSRAERHAEELARRAGGESLTLQPLDSG